MSLSEIIAELPRLSDEERWELIERAMEMDDFSKEELQLIDKRLADHDRDPESWLSLDQLTAKLREQGRL